MTTLFQSANDKNPSFSLKGNGQFGNVTRTGWKPSRLGVSKKQMILNALNDNDVQQAYKRGRHVYAFLLNGTELKLF